MKLRLIECRLFEKFDPSFQLSYDAQDLVANTDDESKSMYGTIEVDVNDDVFYYLWEFIKADDDRNEIISDEQLDDFADNDAAWEAWVEENYQMLLDRYLDEFKEAFFETAQDDLYNNWDDHCDEPCFNQQEDDMESYYDLVAQGLKLR